MTHRSEKRKQSANKAQSEDDKSIDKAQSKREADYSLTEITIVRYIESHPKATQIEIAAAVEKSRRTVQKTIARLKENGIIEREGSRMNGRWIVKR